MSVKVANTRIVAREGVNAVQAFFEAQGCVFQEVAQQNDFGKDGYVDIAQSGVITSLCAAVQVKSGKSFRATHGNYFVPVEKHAHNWRQSTVPVFGLVYDPSDRMIRWADLTGYLRDHPRQDGGTIPVSGDAVLNSATLHSEFAPAVSNYVFGAGAAIALNLLSPGELQADAVFDAWALGRHDARYLVLLRRLVADLEPGAVRRAIAALAHAAPHPDIFWTKDNWIPKGVEEVVQATFRWSPEEIAHMIRAIHPEDWGRGTLGQSFDVLMYEDPNIVSKLHSSIGLMLATNDVTAAVRAATLVLSHSRDARLKLASVLREYPALAHDDWFQELSAHVNEWGTFSLY